MLTEDEIMAQVLAVFQEEQAEHRHTVGTLLLELEQNPNHPQRAAMLDQLFREAHSLKGAARAAGLNDVEQLAHRIEDLFTAVRRGQLALTHEVCDPIYMALDAIGVLMGQVAARQPTDITPYRSLLETLACLGSEPTEQSAPAQPAPAEQRASTSTESEATSRQGNKRRKRGSRSTEANERSNGQRSAATQHPTDNEPLEPNVSATGETLGDTSATTVRISTAHLDSLLNQTGELITASMRAQQRAREAEQINNLLGRWRRIWRQVRPAYHKLREYSPGIRPAVHYLEDREDVLVAPVRTTDRDTAIVLDALKQAHEMISELERTMSQLASQTREDSTRLTNVVDRLHHQVRRTRMMPLATIFSQVRLQVREMERAAGKKMVLELDDDGAEADRPVLERLRDVLLHLLRNAFDHGIEPVEQRIALGKPPEGHVSVRARVAGDRLTLTISDDGAGLDMEAIRRRAQAAGMLADADLSRVGETELADLIFLPGFSTRPTVSTLSGRGVGLDIVRTHVERMHGRVSVRSTPGAGCVFTIDVPLSLTSSHGLLLRAGEARYVLSLDSVQRIVPVAPRDIQIVEGRAATVYAGRPLPLVYLADLLNDQSTSYADLMSRHRLALVLGTGDRQVACLVDAVLDEQELVVHRLPAPLQQVRMIAGATILADGQVVPILDVVDLLRAVIGARQPVVPSESPGEERRVPTILVVDDSITTRTLEKNILEAAGYKVRMATDGVEALQVLRQLLDGEGCDLLLSDIDMPRLNGFELTSQIRSDARMRHLPVVLVTSLDTPADRERGIAAGADAYIVKRSFEQQALLETIAHLIA